VSPRGQRRPLLWRQINLRENPQGDWDRGRPVVNSSHSGQCSQIVRCEESSRPRSPRAFGGVQLPVLRGASETISPRNIARIEAMGGGIAIQDRMAFAGEFFVERYGAQAAAHAPPIRQMLESGIPVGAGTDATRVASYDPWISLYWMVTGRTVGGMQLASPENRLSRSLRSNEHYTRFLATTKQSAPPRRIGTFGLAVGAACAFSLGIAGQVLTFRTRARLSFAPSTCRMPLGQSQDIPQADPGGRVSPGFE
jgi:hypothetical protein